MLTLKINKISLEPQNTSKGSKMIKMSTKYQMTKKNLLKDQNNPKISKMTKIPTKLPT
jgi:hypothetical protein